MLELFALLLCSGPRRSSQCQDTYPFPLLKIKLISQIFVIIWSRSCPLRRLLQIGGRTTYTYLSWKHRCFSIKLTWRSFDFDLRTVSGYRDNLFVVDNFYRISLTVLSTRGRLWKVRQMSIRALNIYEAQHM